MQRRELPLTGIWRPMTALVVLSILALAMGSSPAQAKGFLGVQLQELDSALTEALDLGEVDGGILVTEVVEDSPAEAAGLKRGDIILRYGDKAVRGARSLTRMVESTEVGETVTLEFLRKGVTQTAQVEIGRHKSSGKQAARVMEWSEGPGETFSVFIDQDRPLLGVQIRELDAKLGRYFGTDEGLLVLEVFDESAAEEAGIEVGDVLLKVDGEAITEVEALHETLEDYEDGDMVTVTLLRDKQEQAVDVEMRRPEEVEISKLHGGGPNVFRFHGDDFRWHGDEGSMHMYRHKAPHAPEAEIYLHEMDDDDLDDELDELRRELKELRKELEELKEK